MFCNNKKRILYKYFHNLDNTVLLFFNKFIIEKFLWVARTKKNYKFLFFNKKKIYLIFVSFNYI